MLRARIDRFKEDWFLFLGKLAALSTPPQFRIVSGGFHRRDAQEAAKQAVPLGEPAAARPGKLIA